MSLWPENTSAQFHQHIRVYKFFYCPSIQGCCPSHCLLQHASLCHRMFLMLLFLSVKMENSCFHAETVSHTDILPKSLYSFLQSAFSNFLDLGVKSNYQTMKACTTQGNQHLRKCSLKCSGCQQANIVWFCPLPSSWRLWVSFAKKAESSQCQIFPWIFYDNCSCLKWLFIQTYRPALRVDLPSCLWNPIVPSRTWPLSSCSHYQRAVLM